MCFFDRATDATSVGSVGRSPSCGQPGRLGRRELLRQRKSEFPAKVDKICARGRRVGRPAARPPPLRATEAKGEQLGQKEGGRCTEEGIPFINYNAEEGETNPARRVTLVPLHRLY